MITILDNIGRFRMRIKTVYARGLTVLDEQVLGGNLSVMQVTILAVVGLSCYTMAAYFGFWYPSVVMVPAAIYIAFKKGKRYKPVEHALNLINFIKRNLPQSENVKLEEIDKAPKQQVNISGIIRKINEMRNGKKDKVIAQ
jgi:hypothetical protein